MTVKMEGYVIVINEKQQSIVFKIINKFLYTCIIQLKYPHKKNFFFSLFSI